jgi:hypothetical protein
MAKSGRASSPLIPTTPLLVTESRDEFNRICDTLNDQIEPRGIIEQMYVEDIAYLVWEIDTPETQQGSYRQFGPFVLL